MDLFRFSDGNGSIDKKELQDLEGNLVVALIVKLVKVLAQVVANLVRKESKAKYFAEQTAQVAVFFEFQERQNHVRIESFVVIVIVFVIVVVVNFHVVVVDDVIVDCDVWTRVLSLTLFRP